MRHKVLQLYGPPLRYAARQKRIIESRSGFGVQLPAHEYLAHHGIYERRMYAVPPKIACPFEIRRQHAQTVETAFYVSPRDFHTIHQPAIRQKADASLYIFIAYNSLSNAIANMISLSQLPGQTSRRKSYLHVVASRIGVYIQDLAGKV